VSLPTRLPRRMCMGCGQRAPQHELIRIGNAPDGRIHVVSGRRRAGRTGYLHHQRACWDGFAMRKGFVRSLGRPLDKTARGALLESLLRAEHSAMVIH